MKKISDKSDLKRIMSVIAAAGCGFALVGCSHSDVKTVTFEVDGKEYTWDVKSIDNDGNGNYNIKVEGSDPFSDNEFFHTETTPIMQATTCMTFPVPVIPTTTATIVEGPLVTEESASTTTMTAPKLPWLSTTTTTMTAHKLPTTTTTMTAHKLPTTTTTMTAHKLPTTTTMTAHKLPSTTTTTTTTTTTIMTAPKLPSTTTETVTNLEGEINRYYCETGYADEVDQQGDTLYKIAGVVGINYVDLMNINGLFDFNIKIGQHLIVPATLVYYNAYSESNYSEVAYSTGVDENVLCILNNVSRGSTLTNKNVLVQTLPVYKNFYETYRGRANLVGNTVIIGDKLVYGSGEANNTILSLVDSRLEYGCNEVVLYKMDNNGNWMSNSLCSNAKDIDVIDGIPVVYYRTQNDVASIAVDDYSYVTLKTVCYLDYPIYFDNNSNELVTFDGKQHGFIQAYGNSKTR